MRRLHRSHALSAVSSAPEAALPLQLLSVIFLTAFLLLTGLVGCSSADPVDPSMDSSTAQADEAMPQEEMKEEMQGKMAKDERMAEGLAKATFAGGCFWCMEKPFDVLDGVVSTTSGYTGGEVENPSYERVSSGTTRHLEAVQVVYDPETIGYETLLQVFWHNIDPTDGGGQFCDRGYQYTTAVFAHDEEQRRLAEASKREIEASGRFDQPLDTPIRDAVPFYAAEDYHQNFYKKSPVRYTSYRTGCGRDRRLTDLWGDLAGVAGGL